MSLPAAPAATVAELVRGLAAKRYSSVELTRAYLDRVAAAQPELNAFITVTGEAALAAAARADEARAAGRGGPLTGVPLAHKDIFCTEGVLTTCGSKMLANFVSPYDATVVAGLRQAGTVMLGKLNMDEFAMGSSNETSYFGPVRNPWDTARVPGGSSGGSAAAVAARIAPAATATDTGGSIRQPAALCGVTGIKPTYGLVSRRGVFPLAFSLDHVGPLTRTVHDNATVLNVLAGHDGLDPGSVARPGVDYTALTRKGLKGVRIGWLKHFYHDDIKADPQMAAAIDAAVLKMQELGAQVTEVKTVALSQFQACNRIIMGSESYAIHQKWLRDRPQDYGDITRQRFLYGAMYSASYYINALRMRSKFTADFHALFNDVDVIVTASAHDPACRIDDQEACEFIYSRQARAPFNVTGSPAIAVPAGFSQEGLPLGIQIVGAPYNEATVYRVGAAYEAATAWTAKHPVLPA